MFGTMRRTHIFDLFCSYPDDEAAGFGFTFGLEHAGCLFLLSISRPAIIGPTVDIESGMGQRPKSRREITGRLGLGAVAERLPIASGDM